MDLYGLTHPQDRSLNPAVGLLGFMLHEPILRLLEGPRADGCWLNWWILCWEDHGSRYVAVSDHWCINYVGHLAFSVVVLGRFHTISGSGTWSKFLFIGLCYGESDALPTKDQTKQRLALEQRNWPSMPDPRAELHQYANLGSGDRMHGKKQENQRFFMGRASSQHQTN